MDNHQMIKKLKKAGVSFAPGMSAFELDRAENVFGFHFPKEIREFLSCGVPVGGFFLILTTLQNLTRRNFSSFRNQS